MANLQAVLDFSVELHKFVNVDLFQRGFYQVRVLHRVSSKIGHKIEVNYSRLGKDVSDSMVRNGGFGGNIVFPPCIVNGAAVSKTFQILYKNEEVELNDVLSFKTHLLLDASRCMDQVRRVNFLLDVELWFTDQDFGPEHHSSIGCVSSRQLQMHVDLCRGLHCHMPVLFDYFHLSAVTLSIHCSLVTLCQPYLQHRIRSRAVDPDPIADISGYDDLLFGCSLSLCQELDGQELQMRMRRAQLVHWQLCSLIFTSSQSVERRIQEFRSLSSRHRHHHHNHQSHHKTEVKPSSKSMSSLAQACYKSFSDGSRDRNKDSVAHQNLNFPSEVPADVLPGDYITLVESDLAYLSGLSILQWEQFLKLVVHSEKIAHHLAKVHHKQRINRFAEAFFVIERPHCNIMSLCDKSGQLFTEICDSLRKSHYFQLLPSCDVECLSLDGDSTTLPVIFEEKYAPPSPDPVSGLEQPLANLLSTGTSDQQPLPSSRSLREKLMTRLALNSPSRTSSLSPSCGRRSGSCTSCCDPGPESKKRMSAETRSRSQTRSEMRSAVTMTDLQDMRWKKERMVAVELPDLTLSSSLTPDRNLTKMTYSESLPDLSVFPSFAKLTSKRCVSILPHRRTGVAVDFGPERETISEMFEGTAYFPRPPPEFAKSAPGNAGIAQSSQLCEQIAAKLPGMGEDGVNGSSDPEVRKDECTESQILTPRLCLQCLSLECKCSKAAVPDLHVKQEDVNENSDEKRSAVSSSLFSFLEAKEEFRSEKVRGWNIYSDFPHLASKSPYFHSDDDIRNGAFPQSRGQHLIVCVHGLDGNSADLRLIRTYLELGLPGSNFEFLMSQRNQGETFECFETLRDRLVNEIIYHIEVFRLKPTKISFIGHSLGNIIIRGALSQPLMKPWLSKLHTFLSLSGPHLGTAYNSSGLVNMGLWVFQKWKKSASLLQLTMKDNVDPRQCYLYKLSQEPGLEHFENVLLCGSTQDNYVPVHSAHIELCTSAVNDASVYGCAYREMVSNLLQPIAKRNSKLIRFDVHHALLSNANSLIGRAAHIAVLDSELFIEKFMVVCGLQYFA